MFLNSRQSGEIVLSERKAFEGSPPPDCEHGSVNHINFPSEAMTPDRFAPECLTVNRRINPELQGKKNGKFKPVTAQSRTIIGVLHD